MLYLGAPYNIEFAQSIRADERLDHGFHCVIRDRIPDVPKSPGVEISGAADFIYMFIQGHLCRSRITPSSLTLSDIGSKVPATSTCEMTESDLVE